MANKIEWCDLCHREHPYPLKNTGPLSYVGLRLSRLKRDAKGRFIKVTKTKVNNG